MTIEKTYSGMAASPNSFVRVGRYYDDTSGPARNLIEYSDDGVAWAEVDYLANGFGPFNVYEGDELVDTYDHTVADVCWTGQYYVAVGRLGLIWMSVNGYENWVVNIFDEIYGDESVFLKTVAAFNPFVIAASSGGHVIFSTTNGLVWEFASFSAEYYEGYLEFIDSYVDSENYYLISADRLESGPLESLIPTTAIPVSGVLASTSASARITRVEQEVRSDLLTFTAATDHFAVAYAALRATDFNFSVPGPAVMQVEAAVEAAHYSALGYEKEVDSSMTATTAADALQSITAQSVLEVYQQIAITNSVIVSSNLLLDAVASALAEIEEGTVAVSSSLVATADTSVGLRFARMVADNLGLTGDAHTQFVATVASNVSATSVLQASFLVALYESIQCDVDAVGVPLAVSGGDYQPEDDQYAPGAADANETWAYNTEGGQTSRYVRSDYASMVNTSRGIYATDGSALYLLEGNTDAGDKIPCYVEWGTTDFGTAFEKNVERGYIGVASAGQLVLRVVTNKRTEDWYEVILEDSGQHGARIKIGKGLKARYWKFRLENFDGEGFDLESIEFKPVTMSRRVR